jgi:hypothetical protein
MIPGEEKFLVSHHSPPKYKTKKHQKIRNIVRSKRFFVKRLKYAFGGDFMLVLKKKFVLLLSNFF